MMFRPVAIAAFCVGVFASARFLGGGTVDVTIPAGGLAKFCALAFLLACGFALYEHASARIRRPWLTMIAAVLSGLLCGAFFARQVSLAWSGHPLLPVDPISIHILAAAVAYGLGALLGIRCAKRLRRGRSTA